MKTEELEFKTSLKNKKRTLSRIIAAQILYQYHFLKDERNIEEVKSTLIENYVLFENDKEKDYSDKIDNELVDKLILGVEDSISEADEKILKLRKKDQEIEDFLMEILRLANFELENKTAPKEVIIHEYVDISSLFFDDSKVSFVNSLIENLSS